MTALSKLAHFVDGELRIVDQSPLIVPIDKLARAAQRERILAGLRRIVDTYRDSLPIERRVLFDEYRLADLARHSSATLAPCGSQYRGVESLGAALGKLASQLPFVTRRLTRRPDPRPE